MFKSLKGNADVGTINADTPSATHDSLSTREEKRPLFGQSPASTLNPSPQSRPYPGLQTQADSFAPPPGPPPFHAKSKDEYGPPPGPPPSANPSPYHDWTVIPDTALLPPPPAFPQEYSSTNNASYRSAEAAHAWCEETPLFTPSIPNQTILDAVNRGELSFQRPQTLARHADLRQAAPGTWRCKTKKGQQDAILLSALPVYFAAVDSPLKTGMEKVVYYELRVIGLKDSESGIAIGYSAKPYPPWRLPGWHRASLAVHGDDGRRFVNDSWGGRDFVSAFEVGDVVGLGVRYLGQELGGELVKTKVFFTRNGREEGGWDIDEERDAENDEGIGGLQGEVDQYPAVGIFGGVEVEVRFRKDEWMYRPN